MKAISPITKDKNKLRKLYLTLLKKVSKTNNEKWSKIILQTFFYSHYFKQNQVFALYHALPHEVQTKDLIELLWNNAKVVCLPRINGKVLEFYIINSWNDIVIDNNYHIGQPRTTCKKISSNEIECMLVPLVAFDEYYYRIGYGKGFYDHYLSQNHINFQKIGLGFAMQKIPFVINHDSWDIPLDFIITN